MILTETLKTRPTPPQARARERVRTILATTADLLLTHPPERISTTMIATAADIPVSSIYRYFPTAEDVLRELYLQTAGEIRSKLFATLSAPTGTWRERMIAGLATQHQYIAQHPFYRPLMLSFLSYRSPIAIQDEEHGELVRFLEQRWTQGLDGFRGGNPAVVARMVVQIALSVEDMASTELPLAEELNTELAKVLDAYLSNYLSD